MAFSRTKAKYYLAFLWVGSILTVVVGVLVSYYEKEINSNTYLLVLMLIIFAPTGIAYLSLMAGLMSELKGKLLFLVPLAFFPYFLLLVILFAPYMYLIYLTHGYWKLTRHQPLD